MGFMSFMGSKNPTKFEQKMCVFSSFFFMLGNNRANGTTREYYKKKSREQLEVYLFCYNGDCNEEHKGKKSFCCSGEAYREVDMNKRTFGRFILQGL